MKFKSKIYNFVFCKLTYLAIHTLFNYTYLYEVKIANYNKIFNTVLTVNIINVFFLAIISTSKGHLQLSPYFYLPSLYDSSSV